MYLSAIPAPWIIKKEIRHTESMAQTPIIVGDYALVLLVKPLLMVNCLTHRPPVGATLYVVGETIVHKATGTEVDHFHLAIVHKVSCRSCCANRLIRTLGY